MKIEDSELELHKILGLSAIVFSESHQYYVERWWKTLGWGWVMGVREADDCCVCKHATAGGSG